MRLLLAAVLASALAAPARALGEGDEDDAVPGLQSPSGLVLYYASSGPLSFVAMTPKDVPADAVKIREVRGRACQRGLAVPVAADFNATNISAYRGDGGYAKALARIKADHPEVVGIYDVRSDVEVFSVLGIYRSRCTVVTARAFALPGAPKP